MSQHESARVHTRTRVGVRVPWLRAGLPCRICAFLQRCTFVDKPHESRPHLRWVRAEPEVVEPAVPQSRHHLQRSRTVVQSDSQAVVRHSVLRVRGSSAVRHQYNLGLETDI
eukprot:5856691-Pyramimonas_sp.AAC.1